MGITTSCFHHLKEVERRVSGEGSSGGVEERIERSKVHWSTLDEVDVTEGDGEAEVSNVVEFLALQRHPTWGDFFQTFGYDLGDRYERAGELVVGEKFAEGGQAELYDCKVKLWAPEFNKRDVKLGFEYVLKVFKKGTYLKQVKSQLPQGLLQYHVKEMENLQLTKPVFSPRFYCQVHRGTLLEDGRFAFLMAKEHFDLRQVIIENMKSKSGNDCGPFSKEDVELIMFQVALGVDWLHRHGIVHKDLKASNVLVNVNESGWPKWVCYVADYECSVGVVGTGFFRAPEILQACKERKLGERSEVFSNAADIYGFGMICYEVLTGKLPFEDRGPKDYDHVLSGHQLLVPDHVEVWICELLDKCWQLDSANRPCIGDILSVILTHSNHARRVEEYLKNEYGQNYREGYGAS